MNVDTISSHDSYGYLATISSTIISKETTIGFQSAT